MEVTINDRLDGNVRGAAAIALGTGISTRVQASDLCKLMLSSDSEVPDRASIESLIRAASGADASSVSRGGACHLQIGALSALAILLQVGQQVLSSYKKLHEVNFSYKLLHVVTCSCT